MPRLHVIQNAFTAGEWSPLLYGRSDLEKYRSACKTIENATVFKHGGATRRAGTRFVKEVKTSASATRLVAYPSKDGNFILEFGVQYIRVYENGAWLSAVEVPTTYAAADLFELQFHHTSTGAYGDSLIITHRDYEPQRLYRISASSWSMIDLLTWDGPYLAENTTATTITPSAATGNITLTASASIFATGHVGTLFAIKVGANVYGHVIITGFTSGTVVAATVRETLTAAGATAVWKEGAFSGVRGYPATCTEFQQRLIFGGTTHQPRTLWGSTPGDLYLNLYVNMDEGTGLDDEAFKFSLVSARNIRWLSGWRSLIVGDEAAVIALEVPNGEPMTPSMLPEERTPLAYGAAAVKPVKIHNSILFLQRSKKAVREMVFNFGDDGYIAPDVSILAEHILEGGITQLAYQDEPDSIVWAVRDDGTLVGCTFERPEQVIAWHRHITGGDADLVDGQFESVAVIPHPNGDRDQVWFIVKRIIGGATKRYVEYFDTVNGTYDDIQVDSAVLYSGASTTTLTGLSHLNGELVDVLGNGVVLAQETVASGSITLDTAVTVAEVGLHYGTTITTMRPEVATGTGSVQGLPKSVHDVSVRVHESIGFSLNGEQVDFREGDFDMDEQVPTFTGDKRVFNPGWDEDGLITITQTQPLPLTVLAVYGILTVGP